MADITREPWNDPAKNAVAVSPSRMTGSSVQAVMLVDPVTGDPIDPSSLGGGGGGVTSDSDQTASFIVPDNSEGTRFNVDSASDIVATINENSISSVGLVAYFRQVGVGKITFTNGANVDPILDSGVLGTVTPNDYVAIIREKDNGANKVYTII